MKQAEALTRLGSRVDTAWRQAHYADDALADIATEHLQHTMTEVDVDELCQWLLTSQPSSQTMDPANLFGQPPFSIYESDLLVVQLLWWMSSTTAIHEHTFTGAFGVLVGSSLHTRYRFEAERRWSARLQTGALKVIESERLQQGDVRPIRPYGGSLHALFHLEQPSVSIVVRSRQLAKAQPQLNLLPPGLALDPFYKPPLAVRRMRLVSELVRIKHPRAIDHAMTLVGELDAHGAVTLALDCEQHLEREARKQFFHAVVARHGNELEILDAVCEERKRRTNLQARRERIIDADQRYLLALLLNAPDRATYLELAGRQTDDPIEWTLKTLSDLQQQALEIEDDEAGLGIDLDDASRFVLRGVLEGRSESELTQSVPRDLKAPDVQKACFVLPHIKAFKPLWTDASDTL